MLCSENPFSLLEYHQMYRLSFKVLNVEQCCGAEAGHLVTEAVLLLQSKLFRVMCGVTKILQELVYVLEQKWDIQPLSIVQGRPKSQAPKSIFVILFFLEQPCIRRGCLLHPMADL